MLKDARASFRKSLGTLLPAKAKTVAPDVSSKWATLPSTGDGVPPELENDPTKSAKTYGFLEASASVKAPDGTSYHLRHGSVVIAAITSCTNTSNPSVLLAAGLLARNAVETRASQPPLGQDQPGPWLEGGHRLSDGIGAHSVPRSPQFLPGRLWLHDLYRKQRSPAGPHRPGGHRAGISPSPPSFRVTGTSKAESTPSSEPITWPHRLWSSRTRWPGT